MYIKDNKGNIKQYIYTSAGEEKGKHMNKWATAQQPPGTKYEKLWDTTDTKLLRYLGNVIENKGTTWL